MIGAILSWGVAAFSAAVLVTLIVILVRRSIHERDARRRPKHESHPFHDDMTTQGGFGD